MNDLITEKERELVSAMLDEIFNKWHPSFPTLGQKHALVDVIKEAFVAGMKIMTRPKL